MYKVNKNELNLNFLFFICLNIFLVNCATISERKNLSKHPKLVVLSYDGFRYDYMDKTDTPTLDRLKAEGVHSPYMKAQFTTKTFPNHQSIATGLHTENHGIMDNQVYDPDYGQLSGYLPYNEEFWRFRNDVAPIWIQNEWAKDGRYSGASWPGSNHPYGPEKTFPTHYLTYNKSLSFEDRVEYVIDWLTDEEKPANLVFMYFDEPDGQGHAFGPESPEVIAEIKRMDKVTELLLTRLKEEEIDDQVNIIILSDHGFQEVSLRNTVNITALVNFESIEDPYVGTPISQFRPKEGKLDEVYEALKEGSKNLNFSVYKKEELPKEWHFGDNRRIMPIVVLADLGFVFDDFANRYNTSSLDRKFGVHGYDNAAASMRAFFLGYGPVFKKGVEIPSFENVDLFPLICKIMNIEPAPNNGTLNVVSQALASTTTSTTTSTITSTTTSTITTPSSGRSSILIQKSYYFLTSLTIGISVLFSSSLMLCWGS